MKKNAGLTYVSDFTFSSEQGFTGSAGKSNVKGYMRGGHVKKDPVKAAAQKHRAPGPGAAQGGYMKGGMHGYEDPGPLPKNVKAKGGKMEYGDGGYKKGGYKKGYRTGAGVGRYAEGGMMEYDDDYGHGGTVGVTTKRGPKSKRTKSTMTKAARGGSMHDKLYNEGGKMGYKKGGQVKDTSSEFLMDSGPQNTMDDGVQPKRKGRNQAAIEAGGTKRVKPKFRKGGKVGAKDLPGTGGLRRAADAIEDRQKRVRNTVDEAQRAARKSMGGSKPKPQRHDKAPTQAKSKPAPGSQRGKRKHYGLAFSSTPMVK